MKITTLQDIDLSAYKLAFYHGSSLGIDMSYERALKFAQAGVLDDDFPKVWVFLVPKESNLTIIWGDDFDDTPASDNAGFPTDSTLPKGTMILSGVLGGELQLIQTIE